MRSIDAEKLFLESSRNGFKVADSLDEPLARVGFEMGVRYMMDMIAIAPEVDAVPVKHGKWNYKNYEDFGYVPCCSVCGEPDALSRDDYAYRGGKIRDNHSDYCPNCGAKMDGGEENA